MVVNIVDNSMDTTSSKLLLIRHQKTPHKTLHLNGLAERMNMTFMERVRCFLSKAKLSNSFLGDALLTVAHIIHLSRLGALKSDVPNFFLYRQDVSYDHLIVFSCKTFVKYAER